MAVGVWQALLRAAAVATLALASAGVGASAALAQARAAPTPPKGVPVPHEVTSRMLPLKSPRTELVEFDLAPFPTTGVLPAAGRFSISRTRTADAATAHRAACCGRT
jgi:hypothetical protein